MIDALLRRSLPGALLLALLSACGAQPDVVLYCALDQVFAEPLVARFERETGLKVQAEYDVEASKTVGLVKRLEEEASHPRCDVFWNNEIGHTIKLAEAGMLASYDSPSAASIPAQFRDPEHRWNGFAARARVLIVNTELADASEIEGLNDLFDERWSGKTGLAKPLTGTTLTHAAALFDTLGADAARELLGEVQSRAAQGTLSLVRSNGQLMRHVSAGELAWGWTDTDDFNVAREKGYPVEIVYPDQGDDGMGALVIPNTVAILEKAPHPEAARRLVDWILSEGVEAELAASRSAQIPVRDSVPAPSHVRRLGDFKVMEIDYNQLGRALDERTRLLTEMFLR